MPSGYLLLVGRERRPRRVPANSKHARCSCAGGASRAPTTRHGKLPKKGGRLSPMQLIHNDISSLWDGFDACFVPAHCDAEETVLTPLGTPAVLDPPELLARLLAPANQQDGMVHPLPFPSAVAEEAGGGGGGAVDARLVEHEVLRRLEAQHQRAVVVELRLDCLDARVAIPGPDVAVVGCPEARLAQRSEAALEPAGAADTVTTIATLVVLRAEEREADGPRQQGRIVLPDLVPRGEHPHGRRRVAAPAVP
eukprot:CAMPEP_0179175050 /NCGR_PEP_ID=MMETSP0796-20121207/86436_1 /TAXON_ID=73915 /ORGANISM="Pyrodinium bahamense, Strain pbaha01" /LENGTH=251 /DNA_ID=CAMNT_0020878361 /DNA_START=103 /DNA_END=854 /DNA_ORIENTATION=+